MRANSSIIFPMLFPLLFAVISRIRSLNRVIAFGAILRFGSFPLV